MSFFFAAGSVKSDLFHSRRSCPAPQNCSSPDDDNHYNVTHVPNVPPESESLDEDDEWLSFLTTKILGGQ